MRDNRRVTGGPTFLGEPPATDESRFVYDKERDADGFVWNVSRLWSWRPDVYEHFGKLRKELTSSSALTDRDQAVMVTAMAATLGDSYCSLAWGKKLAALTDPETAVEVIDGVDQPAALSGREAALAAWTRAVVRDPNATTPADVERLRAAGLDEREIFEATVFVAFRLAFSTVNDALGAGPDKQLAESAPSPVREAVAYGRPAGAEPSSA
jgi:alkylhydroperoxidase family enzyme